MEGPVCDAVPISGWENVLALMTGVSLAKIRICKVRVINAMKVGKPKEWRAVGSPSCDAVEAAVAAVAKGIDLLE